MRLQMETVGLAQDKTCRLPVTQADLAEMTGLSNVYVNRTLLALRKQGLLSLGQGTLTIQDWTVLAELGGFPTDYLHLHSQEAA
jgi:CRP-like cAMP-binding protein